MQYFMKADSFLKELYFFIKSFHCSFKRGLLRRIKKKNRAVNGEIEYRMTDESKDKGCDLMCYWSEKTQDANSSS